MQDNLYREELLEEYRNPRNFGKLQNSSAASKQLNPFCGDEIEVFVNFDNQTINDISFLGKGCAISIASTSLLTDFAKGKTKKELTNFSDEDMLKLIGIEVSETRKKCALLGLFVLRDCIK